jgi:hypothetical protein
MELPAMKPPDDRPETEVSFKLICRFGKATTSARRGMALIAVSAIVSMKDLSVIAAPPV